MTTKRLTTEEFILRSNKIHKNKYDYSNVVYKNGKSKVEIICPLHGLFNQRPYNHSIGEGCPSCRLVFMKELLSMSLEEFIDKARKIHKDEYDYSKVIYLGNKKKVEIICHKHGTFWQISGNHLQGQTCPECAKIIIADKNRKTTDEFIKDAIKIHGNKYDYSKVDYKCKDENIIIICKKHGDFLQIPHNHLHGAGCSKCVSSKGEQKICQILDYKNINYYRQKVFLGCISPKNRMLRFDFYIPDKNMLIEYDGPQHYGDLRIGKYTLKKKEYETLKIHDKIKNDYVKSNNITLLRIPHWKLKDVENIISQYL